MTAIRGQTIISSHTHTSPAPILDVNTDSDNDQGPWCSDAGPGHNAGDAYDESPEPSPAPAPVAPMSDSGSGSGCGDSGPENLMSRVLVGSNLLTLHLSTPECPLASVHLQVSNLDNPSM